jgi:hypothetical protein
MPNRDKTGPKGEGQGTGRGKGSCVSTEKSLEDKRVNDKKGRGMGPCGGGQARGGCKGRRRGSNGITYFV